MHFLYSFLTNWEFIIVGIVFNITTILGFVVFWANKKSVTHKFFFGFSLAIAIWGLLNYLSFQPFLVLYSLIILRFTLFSVTWLTFFFLMFSISFPGEETGPRKTAMAALWVLSFIISVFTLTPLVLKEVTKLSPEGVIISATNGPLMPFFGMTTVGYTIAGIIVLLFKTFRADKINRKRLLWVTVGLIMMFFSLIITNFLLPVVFDNTSYLPFAAIFVFPFLVFISYSIIRYRLMNARIVGTIIFISFLLVLSIIQLAQIEGSEKIIIQIVVLTGLVITSLLLIRSILQEVEHLEKLAELNKNLRAAYGEVDKLNKAKSEFISIASHQLRTPLTAIKGYISMILEGSYGEIKNEKVKKKLKRVYQSNERLKNFVNNLLNLSKIEVGKIEMKFEKASLEKIISDLIEDFKIELEEKGLFLKFEKPKIKLPQVLIDIDKTRQIISNLIDNSIKYTEKGGITVKTQDLKNKIQIIVSDTGIGMTKEELSFLFERFSRGYDSLNYSEGAGLGLYIAKRFTEMQNGKIWAESEGGGRGSAFYIELPIKL